MADDPKKLPYGIVDNDMACGLAPLDTPSWDPSTPNCVVHDLSFDENKAGDPNPGIIDTTLTFDEGEGKTLLKSVYGVVTAIPYAVLATVIGVPLWFYEKWSGKDPAKPDLLVQQVQPAPEHSQRPMELTPQSNQPSKQQSDL